MSAPICLECGTHPVKRAHPTEPGAQVIDGTSWRRYCSRVCVGRVRGRGQHGSAEGVRAWRRRAFHARLRRYKAACEAVATPEGMVPILEMVRVMAAIERVAYARGSDAATRRIRKIA